MHACRSTLEDPTVTKDGVRSTLKFAPVAALDDEELLSRFIKEAWNAERAADDAPDYFASAFTPERPTARYYVQEFVEAPSLKGVLKSRPLSVDETVSLGKFLCAACERLLGLNLVHGDLKPENILVLSDYDRLRFKLIDLGTAAEVFSESSRAGTASFLAPERFHGAPVCERAEIFSIGVTLFESLTRRLPFGFIERFQTPVFHPASQVSSLNPNVPPWLNHVIARALSVDPIRRYQHFSEMAFDLEHPDQVEPYFRSDSSLLDRNPLAFYRAGFWLLLAISLGLLICILSAH